MRKLHLLCNAHLDPVWLWRRNEGMAEAISTFRVAADFCESYDGLYVLNDGIYGGSFTNSCIKLSLLRTPVYSAHPIGKRPIAPHNRFTNHIDMGERHFSFRIISDDNIPKQAQIYNQKSQALSFFPSGDGKKTESAVVINNPDILLSSFKKVEQGYKITLYNSVDFENDAVIEIPALNKKLSLHFTKHELKIFDLNTGE